MSRAASRRRRAAGIGLVEVMIGIIIGMLLILVIYQIYEVSESQKRTITAGSDAQQSAAYGVYAIGRDLAMAGSGLASSAAALMQCAILRPIPVLIQAGATAATPDTITVIYGGSSSLSTAVRFQQAAATTAPYVVQAPVGFSPNDLIAAIQGAVCTVSTVNNAPGSVTVNPANGFATILHTPVAGNMGANYGAINAVLVNLGPAPPAVNSMRNVVYSVNPASSTLTSQDLLPVPGPVNPVISEVINVKAEYGVDSNCTGALVWQAATGAWSPANVQAMPLNTPPVAAPNWGCVAGTPTLQQIRAARIAIVTRSAKYETDPIVAGSPPGMPTGTLGLFCDPAPTCAYTIPLSSDDQHYRYKILESVVPFRNALWNLPPP